MGGAAHPRWNDVRRWKDADSLPVWTLLQTDEVRVRSAPLRHKVPCHGYVVEEPKAEGEMNFSGGAGAGAGTGGGGGHGGGCMRRCHATTSTANRRGEGRGRGKGGGGGIHPLILLPSKSLAPVKKVG